MNEVKIKSYIITILIAVGLITVSFFIGSFSGCKRFNNLETDLRKSRAVIIAERERLGWITRDAYESRKEIRDIESTIGILEDSIKRLEIQNQQNIESVSNIKTGNGQDIEKVQSVIKGINKYIQKAKIKD